MRRNSHFWLYLSIGLLLSLVVVNAGVTYRNIRQLHDDAELVEHAQQVLHALESTLSTVKDAETGQRGYLLTGDATYLEPYEDALVQVGSELARLEKLAADNQGLADRVPQLHSLIDDKLGELALSLKLHREGDIQAAQQLVLSHLGKRTMQRIRDLADELESDERQLLAQRQQADRRAFRSAVLGVLISVVAGIVGLAGLAVLLRRQLSSLEQAAWAESQQRELLRATLASIGDGVIATDLQGRITFLNPVAEQLTGWKQAEAQDIDLEQVLEIVNEQTHQRVENPARLALREASIVSLANHTILISRDGTEWPIDDSAAPIIAPSGQVSGSVLVFREVTQRKKHEAAVLEHNRTLQALNARMNELLLELKGSEELFHTMADCIPQLAWMARPDGHIYWYNKRWYEYTGATPQEMEGWGWQSIHDPEHLPRVQERWQAALASGHPWEDTFPLRRRDGAMRWHLSRAEPVRDEQGKITRWFGTNTDVSHQLQMEEALREANRRKDDFVALLAHELRNPIAPISNALQIWPMVEHDREEMGRLREMMERQVKQIRRLIDDLLDVSRIARGKIQLRPQRVELSTIVAGAVEAVRPFIDSCGHRLVVDVADEPLCIDGDVARLTQALSNLLQNAAKYTQRGGEVHVSAGRQRDSAVISVKDNGAGIPPHLLQRIFDMFQQVDQTLDRSHGGMGLGLTLVKRLVELHGGSVEARSEGEGQGSEFLIALPLATAAHPPTVPKPGPAASPAVDHGLARRRVLVVDDVHASAKMLAMMLERLGQDVAIEYDGAAALEYVAARRPDVVFLDIAMPGLDGYGVAQRLREAQVLDRLTLVALTGYGHSDDRRRAIDAGFHHHLTKPASMEQLIELLGSLPAGSEAHSSR